MNQKYVIAIDQGTTSSRAVLFDSQARTIETAQQEITQSYPQPGWVEHNPEEIWASQMAVVTQALAKAGLDAGNIAGIGITNQRETTIAWNRHTGKPIYPAIVWQDRRTAAFCRSLIQQGREQSVTAKTGLRLDPYFSGTKLAWILNEVPGARKLAQSGDLLFGTVDCWLIWQLTGGKVHATDVTNASRTLMFNIHTGQWDDELLSMLDVPLAMLPQVKSCSEVYGTVDTNIVAGDIPIAGVAGDQHAALFGQACFEKGMAKSTYGTGCFLLKNTGDQAVKSTHNLLTTIAWKMGDRTEYALEGSVFMAGATIQWLRDELGIIQSAAECDQLAAPDNGGVFLVPAFTGLGAPYWDPDARGSIFGLTRGANRSHLCRAALESIAFQNFDLIEAMQADSGIKLEELRVDGGASRSTPLMQFQADILGTPVVRPESVETTARGAAYLAGLAIGLWKDKQELSQHWQADARFEPQLEPQPRERMVKSWRRAVERALKWNENPATMNDLG